MNTYRNEKNHFSEVPNAKDALKTTFGLLANHFAIINLMHGWRCTVSAQNDASAL